MYHILLPTGIENVRHFPEDRVGMGTWDLRRGVFGTCGMFLP